MVLCKRLRLFVSAVFICSSSFLVYAEGVKATSSSTAESATSEMPAAPSMPAVSSLSMPTISAPTIGSTFYTPGRSDGTTASSGTETAGQSSADTSTETKAAAAPAAGNTATLSTAVLNGLASSVTASDLTSLDNAGLLGPLYSSLGSSSASDTSSTNTLLTNILKELNELKQEDKSVIAGSQAGTAAGASDNSAAGKNTIQPAVLRFIVNGYDVLATCRTVYFSSRQSDGSFLLTADRKYVSNGKTRNETFYLLFRTKGSAGFSTQYAVEPAVVQDYANKYSFVYQLAQKKNLSAVKTGNLITMRINEPLYNMDILIDTGSR